MSKLVGKYTHFRSENLDEYFKAVGVPYIPRKMMCASNPTIDISKSDDEKWTINTSTLFRTSTYTFNLGEEYEENMPGVVIKCTANLSDDKLIIECVSPDNSKVLRVYETTDDGMTITYKHEASGKEAVRHFKRTE
ncbi:fatty acid-binding protein-like [Rhynchophorus ferrugineus]|uniref:fatty acid-binding protein-like n=1 Tax=Rhynchophorus ferrugineus TaxID=354439 RepID=UPI003FCE6A9D